MIINLSLCSFKQECTQLQHNFVSAMHLTLLSVLGHEKTMSIGNKLTMLAAFATMGLTFVAVMVAYTAPGAFA